MKISVCLDALCPQLPRPEAVRRLAAMGVTAVEFWGWKGTDLPALAEECRENGVTVAGICTTSFELTRPEKRQEFLDGVQESIAAAKAVGASMLITQSGPDTGAPRAEQAESILAGLRAAAPLLEEAGITYDFSAVNGENRITWEELVEIATEVQDTLDPDGTQGLIGIEFQQVGRTYHMNVLANDMGGVNIAEGGLSVDGVINAEPWLTAMNWYQDQVEAGVFSRGIAANDTPSYFMSDKIVFYLGTTAMPGTFNSNGFEHYGFTYVPCFEGHEADVTTSCGSWTVGMNPYSEKAEAAVEFLKYLCLYEGADVYINTSGMVPALSRQFTDELLTAKPYLAVAQYEGANTALVRAVTPGFNEYATSVNALWDNVRNGGDVAQVAQACVDELTTAFMEYEG